MSHLSIALQSAEKSYTFSFKETSLESIAPNLLDMLPRKKSVRKLTFVFVFGFEFIDFFPINKQIVTIVMKA